MDEVERIERSFTTGPHAELEVSNIRGSIEVRTWERDEVRVMARIGSDGSRDLIDLKIEFPGDRVVVKAEAIKNVRAWMREVFRSNVLSVHFEITCPRTTDISINSVASRVEIENLEGSADINQAAGNVLISDFVGSLAMNSVSGDIAGERLSGPVRFKSVSGDLKIADSHVTGLSIQTVSGNIDLESVAQGDDPITINTVSEGTRLVLDSSRGYTATLRTVSGTVDTDFPAVVIEDSRTLWKADLNGGGRQIRMNSVSGDLELIAAGPTGNESDQSGSRGEANDRTSILKALEVGDIGVDEAVELLGSKTSHDPSENEGRTQ